MFGSLEKFMVLMKTLGEEDAKKGKDAHAEFTTTENRCQGLFHEGSQSQNRQVNRRSWHSTH